MRHVPIEEPYGTVLRIIHQDQEEDSAAVFQIATDGSARNQTGSYAAVLLAPYADIESAVVGRGRISGLASKHHSRMKLRQRFRASRWPCRSTRQQGWQVMSC